MSSRSDSYSPKSSSAGGKKETNKASVESAKNKSNSDAVTVMDESDGDEDRGEGSSSGSSAGSRDVRKHAT